MRLLLDTNIFLEVILEQEKAQVDIFHNVGLRLGALSVEEMERILQPARQFNLDFDDAYQYTLADCYDLIIVSFDADFDRTNRGRKTPSEV